MSWWSHRLNPSLVSNQGPHRGVVGGHNLTGPDVLVLVVVVDVVFRVASTLRTAVLKTLAIRIEDELLSPLDRFRRAVRRVIQQQRRADREAADLRAPNLSPSSFRPSITDLANRMGALGKRSLMDLAWKMEEREELWDRELHRLTHFETIEEPLTISFENLTLTVGETKIIQDLTGQVNAKATCALVRREAVGGATKR